MNQNPVRLELLRGCFAAHTDADVGAGIGEGTGPLDSTAVYTLYRDASMLHRKVTIVGAYGTGSASDPRAQLSEALLPSDRQCAVVQLHLDASLSAEPRGIRRRARMGSIQSDIGASRYQEGSKKCSLRQRGHGTTCDATLFHHYAPATCDCQRH